MSQVTGCEAKTIHRLLEVMWNKQDEPVFMRNEKNVLECDALVIDDSNLLIENNLSIEERLQKFLYIGNCNNIIERYVSGKLINEPIL